MLPLGNPLTKIKVGQTYHVLGDMAGVWYKRGCSLINKFKVKIEINQNSPRSRGDAGGGAEDRMDRIIRMVLS